MSTAETIGDEREIVDELNKDKEEVVMEDFFQTTLDDIDAFEEQSWKKGDGYKFTGFPMVDEKLEGLEFGMYLFAAESNVGKSAVMMNMMYDLCMNPANKLYGVYYSLDDSKFEIIPRIIAMDQLIPIAVCSKPQRYQNMIDNGEEYSSVYETFLEKRRAGIEKLKGNNNLLKIEDSSKIKSAEGMYEHMVMVQNFVKSLDPESNIIVAIDAISDVKFKNKSFASTSDKHSEIARTVKDWATELQIPIFASIHLRKMNQNRRPTLDDLKESGEYVYEASLVWLLYNDVSKNKQSAKMYYNAEGVEDKCPIIELDWAKNKKSSYKGRSYCYFSPEYSKARECDKDTCRRFDTLIYES